MVSRREIRVVSFALYALAGILLYPASAVNLAYRLNHHERSVVSDVFGRPVYSPAGAAVNYSRAELKDRSIHIQSSGASEHLAPDGGRATHPISFGLNGLLGETWRHGVFGSGIGNSRIVTADIDHDMAIEIICGGATTTFGSDDFWYLLEYSEVSGEYQMQWISNVVPQGISSLAAFDTDNNDTFSIYVGLTNGDVRIYDGVTLDEVGYIDSPGDRVNRILFADADNDMVDEISFCDDYNVFIYDATSLSLKAQILYGGSDFGIGDVDSDPALEIVLASGLVIEFDGDTVVVEWDYAGGDFGYLIELSDFDLDNMEEIIGASAWYYITAFDADVQSPKWQINADLDVDALLVKDVDDDCVDDIIYGDGQWGEIHCCDAVTQNQKWQITNPDHGITDIAVFDTDEDGDLEILWGAGASSTGADYLYVYGIPTRSLEWKSEHIDGPFHALDAGDVDSDGEQEIVVASFKSGSGYNDGTVFIFDATTHELEWESEEDMFGGFAWTGVHDLRIADVDDDAVPEIVIATDSLYVGAIHVINGITHGMEQSYFYDDGAPIYSLAVGDVDDDGETEIVAGGGREHTGAPGVYVYVIDGATGVVEWHSISLGGYWSHFYAVEVADIDDDDVLEIVAVNDNVFVFDGVSHQQWQSPRGGCYGMDLCDTDGDAVEEILAGTSDGHIVAIDGETHIEELDFHLALSSIDGLRAYDIEQDGSVELVFGSSGVLSVFSIDDSVMLGRSDTLAYSAGEYNSLAVSDIDEDGRTEVVIGTDYMVVEFQGPSYVSVNESTVLERDHAILLQNYPNPFTPYTEIRYQVPKNTFVSLKIYDIAGTLVTTLIDAEQGQGSYGVRWDGTDGSSTRAASGVYFCTLSAGESVSTKKMVLLR